MLAKTGYQRLHQAVIRGTLAPGTRLSEADLARRLGMSRTPAREALGRLHREGFLVPVGSATRLQLAVAPLSSDDLEDLCRLLSGLEETASRSACALPAAERQDLARRLRQLSEARRRVAARPDADAVRLHELREAFHRALTDAAAPRLRAACEAARPHLQRYAWACAADTQDAEPTAALEIVVAQSLAMSDEPGARRAIAALWQSRVDVLRAALERRVERQRW